MSGTEPGPPSRPPVPSGVQAGRLARSLRLRHTGEILNYAEQQRWLRPELDTLALHDEAVAIYSGWPANQRTAVAAVHALAARHGLRAFGRDYSDEEGAPTVPFDPAAARAIVAGVIKTKEPEHIDLILLWAAHTHMIVRFTSTFYLAHKGRSGAGKGTAVESSILLTPNGEVLSEASDAYLATVLDEGRAIGIEEWDILRAKNPGLEGLVRNGYRRGIFRGFKVPKPDGKGWDLARRSLFGPKVFDTHAGLSGHLLGRSIVIHMDADDSVDRALDAEGKAERLAPVRAALAGAAARALADWPASRVKAHWDSSNFRARVRAMGGRSGRDHVVAANLLLTCDMLGWDCEKSVRAVLAGRTTIEEFGLEAEVAEAIQSLGGPASPDLELLVSDVLKEVNRLRQETGLTTRLNSKQLAGALSELGFRRDVDWGRVKGGPHRDRTAIRPFNAMGARRARIAEETESPRPSGPSGPSRQDEQGKVGTMGTVEQDDPAPLDDVPPYDPEDLFGGAQTRADRARAGTTDYRTAMQRAVDLLGPTITYPDGTVADRVTGTTVRSPRPVSGADRWEDDGGRPGGGS
ncbi:MAG: hypothetical protein L3K16_05785 [Thermoplasmata archaeon]|nr:hypothetical protein [Thermoplasmata archaeon]